MRVPEKGTDRRTDTERHRRRELRGGKDFGVCVVAFSSAPAAKPSQQLWSKRLCFSCLVDGSRVSLENAQGGTVREFMDTKSSSETSQSSAYLDSI